MTSTPEMQDVTETITLTLTEFPEDGENAELRHIVAGVQPFILIEPNEEASEDDLHFNVTISTVDLDTAAATLQAIAWALQAEVDKEAGGLRDALASKGFATDQEAEASK